MVATYPHAPGGYSPPQTALTTFGHHSLGSSPGSGIQQRRVYTERDWERMKSLIALHFLHKNMNLEQVLTMLKERYQFNVTKEQLKGQVRKWGFVKKMTRKVKLQIGKKVRERRRRFPDRKIMVKFRDETLDDAKVRTWEDMLGNEDGDVDVLLGIQIYTLDRDGAPLAQIIETCAGTTAVDYLQVPPMAPIPRHVAVDSLLAYARPLEDPDGLQQYARLVQEATSDIYPKIDPRRGIILQMNAFRNLLSNPDDPIPVDVARKMFSAYVYHVLRKFPKTVEENISPFVTMAIYLSLFLWADINTRGEATFAIAAVDHELRKEKYWAPEHSKWARNFHMHALLHQAGLLASLEDYEPSAEVLARPELGLFHGLPPVQNSFWDCRKCLDLLVDDNPEQHFTDRPLEPLLRLMSFPREVESDTKWWHESDFDTSCDIGFRVRYCGIRYKTEATLGWYEIPQHIAPQCRHKSGEHNSPAQGSLEEVSDTADSVPSSQDFTPDSIDMTSSSVSATVGTPSSGG